MTDESVTPTPPHLLTVKAFGVTLIKERCVRRNEDQVLIAELTKATRIWQTSLPNRRCRLATSAHIYFLWLTAWADSERVNGRAVSGRRDSSSSRSIRSDRLWLRQSRRGREFSRSSKAAIRHADADFLEEAGVPGIERHGMMVTMAFHLGAQLGVIHVGDSRADLYPYFYAGDQLTEDDTVVAEMVRSGALRRDQVADHRLRHTVTNVVGGPELGVNVEARALRSAGAAIA